MKVDVITRHSVPNYGSLLQSYATQKVLEKMDCEVEIIDYTRYDERCNALVDSLIKGKKWDKNLIKRNLYKLIQKVNYSRMYKKFAEYRKNFLKTTEIEYGNLEELKLNKPIADVYCSGSDQIWGKIGKDEYDLAYFLEFAKEDRCIAYSSSFGKEQINKGLLEKLPKLLGKYEKLYVRENTAVDILKNVGLYDAKLVLDPTLLLERKEWETLTDSSINEKEYILVYQLHSNKEFNRYAKEFARKTHKKLLRISPSIYHIVRSGKLIYLPNQYELLGYFKNADYILTDSFHATVFSLIFNKKFIVVPPKNGTITRINSILELTNTKDRILNSYNDFNQINNEINYKKVNEIIDEERNKSFELWKKAIFNNDKTINKLNKKENCTGCGACIQACPKEAIQMKENKEGFIEPIINKEKCINCGICSNICPQLVRKNEFKQPIDIYAVKNKKEDILLNSSSGGFFSVIAEYFINKGGKVFGATLNNNLETEHIGISNLEEIYKIRGSKYVQSNTKTTFKEVQRLLDNDIHVLYTGTPCQIGGLKAFLKKEYEKLCTVEVICHGVPNQRLMKKQIAYLEDKYNDRIINVLYRDKDIGAWGNIGLTVKTEKGNKRFIPAKLNPYLDAFLSGKTYREVCYKCKYANKGRIADITMGDYWGIKKQHPEFESNNGVSAILINNEKGAKIFEEIKNNLCFIKSTFGKVKEENQNLVRPTIRPSIRDISYKDIDGKSFKKYVKENLKYHKRIIDIIKSKVPKEVKEKIKNM